MPVQYRTLNGWALVEGDILLAPVTEVEQPARKSAGQREASAISSQFRLWQDGVIPYVIDPDLPEPERVKEAIQHWQERTSLRFVEHSDEGSYVTFRPGYDGCSATVGSRGPASVVNLSPGCDAVATIHEIGHVIGLFHTQSRQDRDVYIRVRYDNIDRLEWAQYDQHITDGRDIGPYDFGSIMHYPATGFSKNGNRTMQTVPAGIPIGEAQSLSALDIQAVQTLYGRALAKTMISSTPPGLQVLVDGQSYTTPAEFDWVEGETHAVAAVGTQDDAAKSGIRYEFANWSDGGDLEHVVTASGTPAAYDVRYRRLVRISAGIEAGPESEAHVSIEPVSEDGYYLEGTRLRLSPVPDENEGFLEWRLMDGDEDQFPWYDRGRAANPLEWQAEGKPVHLTARFSAKPLTTIQADVPNLFMIVDDEVAATPVSFEWEPGSTHTIMALWGSNYSGTSEYDFLRWKTSDETLESRSIEWKAAEQSGTILAECERIHQVLTAADYYVQGGTLPTDYDFMLTPESDYYGSYAEGTELEITPPSSDSWKFANWYADGSGNQVPYRVKVDGPRVIIGNFLSFLMLNAGAIVNDASRQPGPIAAGERLRIHWSGSNPSEPVSAPDGEPLPTVLGGIEVRFGQQKAGLLSVSKDEIVCVVPDSVRDANQVSVAVVNGRMGTTWVDMAVLSRVPGIYTFEGSGRGAALDRSVRPGEMVEVFATGLDPAAETRVSIDDRDVRADSVEVDSQRPGIYRVIFTVPEGMRAGAAPMFLMSGGRATQPDVQLVIESN